MSITVTVAAPLSIWPASLRLTRLATSVPPTPPPMMTTRFIGLLLTLLLDDDLVVAIARCDFDEPMTGLLDPLGNVELRSAVGGVDGDEVTDLPLADGDRKSTRLNSS